MAEEAGGEGCPLQARGASIVSGERPRPAFRRHKKDKCYCLNWEKRVGKTTGLGQQDK